MVDGIDGHMYLKEMGVELGLHMTPEAVGVKTMLCLAHPDFQEVVIACCRKASSLRYTNADVHVEAGSIYVTHLSNLLLAPALAVKHA